MRRRLIKAVGWRVRLGRFMVPVWTMALGAVLVATVAGQAVGPVLSGSVQGSAGLVVGQTLVLSAAPSVGTQTVDSFGTVTGPVDSVGTVNDEGTAFTVAIETQVGRSQTIVLALANGSGKPANGILELSVPAGVDVQLDSDSAANTPEAQLNRNTWLFKVTQSAGSLYVLLEPKDDAAPGFYTITGRIIQVSH